MASGSRYIIRGGAEGRERLRILARVMQPTTLELLRRAGIRPGVVCLEAGCGGGDVAFDMARLVKPGGAIVATDIDETKLRLAREEAGQEELTNIEFRLADMTRDSEQEFDQEFDFAHARFLLTHLQDPAAALTKMRNALRPGGTIVVEDIDFTGYFCYPDSPAQRRLAELYTETAKRRGGDPNIGPRLPSLLTAAGFENVEMSVVQPASTTGDVKMITPLTMENIADSVIEEGLASREEIDRVIAELYEYANTPGTIGCMPRVFQVWGRGAV
jgi:ubiquinone/menaquinone biosynthesis C-methylase UbiE